MLFWLKKFISFWLMPLSFCVVAMAAGYALMRYTKRVRLGRRLLLGGLIALVLLSNKFPSRVLLRPLETRYPAIPALTGGESLPPALARCRYIAVLGGGNGFSPGFAATNLLAPPALARIVEAVRLARMLPNAKLIVSGPGEPPRETHAQVLARAATELGIARERIILIDTAHDTEDESRAIRQIAGDAPVAVVTSAWHMPRAMALCRSAHVEALACPTDYLSHGNDPLSYDDFLWDVAALGASSLGIRERIGYVWIWLRGKAG